MRISKTYSSNFITIILLLILVGWEVRRVKTNAGCRVVDTVFVTVRDTVTVAEPQLVEEKFFPVEKILERIDTVYIVNDYQMQRIYRDTLTLEYGKLTIVDTVYQNNLIGQEVYTDFAFAAEKPRNRAFGVGAALSSARSMAVDLHFRNNRWTFSAGYDITNKAPLVGVKYDIIKW